MPKQYLATYTLPGGVHYEGNERFEYNVPVVVSEETARKLQQVIVVYTSYGPDGRGVAEPKKKFKLHNYVPPAPSAVDVEPIITDDAPLAIEVEDDDDDGLPAAPVQRVRTPAPE